jgi:hypothetical protein
VAEALAGDGWVVDGNYSQARDLVWRRAQTLVWLDMSLPIVLLRLARRTSRRLITREELWSGNRDRLGMVLSRDSLFLWALRKQPEHRRVYPEVLARAEHAHLLVIRLRSPRQARRWLRELRSPAR